MAIPTPLRPVPPAGRCTARTAMGSVHCAGMSDAHEAPVGVMVAQGYIYPPHALGWAYVMLYNGGFNINLVISQDNFYPPHAEKVGEKLWSPPGGESE
mgnify:FL=1